MTMTYKLENMWKETVNLHNEIRRGMK